MLPRNLVPAPIGLGRRRRLLISSRKCSFGRLLRRQVGLSADDKWDGAQRHPLLPIWHIAQPSAGKDVKMPNSIQEKEFFDNQHSLKDEIMADTHAAIAGSRRVALPGAQALGRANPHTTIDASLKLRLKNEFPELVTLPHTTLSR